MPEVLTPPAVFKRNFDCWNAKEGQTAEGTAAAKVTSMSLLIHVNSTAFLLAKTLFSLKSSLFFLSKLKHVQPQSAFGN